MASKLKRQARAKGELVATTLTEFSAQIDLIRDKWGFEVDGPTSPWFRGQQRKHWELLPSILRDSFSVKRAKTTFDLETESEIREEFVVRAPALSSGEEVPTNEWDFYFLMQHYGAPTRLIDWTESPLIALYFAVRDNPGHYDSAVWVLDPFELNGRVINRGEILAPSALGTSKLDVRKLNKWLPPRFAKSVRLPDYPVAILPTHFVRRISSQKSCFTVHGRLVEGFAKFELDRYSLAKIIVPAYAAPSIRTALQIQGIDETTIFPDLQGLGRALVTKWRRSRVESPHKNAFVRLKPSPIAGVGVFAIQHIPKETSIFPGEDEEILWTSKDKLPKTGAARKVYDDFCIIKSGRYGSPTSFNRLTISWFLNDSKRPNVRCDNNYDFYALRDIRSGEELTVDYSTYSDYPSR